MVHVPVSCAASVWKDVIGTSDVAEWIEQQAEEPASSLFRREAQRPYCLTLASALMHLQDASTVPGGELLLLLRQRNRKSTRQGEREAEADMQETLLSPSTSSSFPPPRMPSLGAVASVLARCYMAPVFGSGQHLPMALLCVTKCASLLAAQILESSRHRKSNAKQQQQHAAAAAAADFRREEEECEIPDAVRIAAAVYGTSVFRPAILAEAMRPGFVVKASMVAEGGRVEDDTHLIRLLAKTPQWVLRLIVRDGIAAGQTQHQGHEQQHEEMPHYAEGTEREVQQMMSMFQFTVKKAAMTALLLRPASDDLARLSAATLDAAFCSSGEILAKVALDLGFETVIRVAQQRPAWRSWYRHALSAALQQRQLQEKLSDNKSTTSEKSLVSHMSSLFASVEVAELAKEYRPLAVLVQSSSSLSSSSPNSASLNCWADALNLLSRSNALLMSSAATEFRHLALLATVESLFKLAADKTAADRTQQLSNSSTNNSNLNDVVVPIQVLQQLARAFSDPLAPRVAARILQIGAASCKWSSSSSWHAALQVHDTIVSKTAAAVASDEYQATLTALVESAAQHSQAAAQISAFADLVSRSKWSRALHVFWRGRQSDASAVSAVPAMRHVAAAAAYSALACKQWSRALQLLCHRQALLAPKTVEGLFVTPKRHEGHNHSWARVLVNKSGAPAAIIEALLPSESKGAAAFDGRSQQHNNNSSATHADDQSLLDVDSANFTKKLLNEVLSSSKAVSSSQHRVISFAYPAQTQSFFEQQQQHQQQNGGNGTTTTATDGSVSLMFESLRSVYRPSATAFAAALNQKRISTVAASSRREHILRADIGVVNSAVNLSGRQMMSSPSTAQGVPLAAVLAVAPPPSAAVVSASCGQRRANDDSDAALSSSSTMSSWMDALELFQDAWMASERGSLPSPVYLGALGFCQEPFQPPLEVTRFVVNATKRAPAFTVDARLAAALIRTAASARLWPDVIECFFLLLDSNQSRVVPNRASIAVVLTACKEIDSRCDRIFADVKMYLEASLEDAFTTLGEDIVAQVAWFKSASTTIVTMEVRCGDFGNLTHVNRDSHRSTIQIHHRGTSLLTTSAATTGVI